MDTNILNFGEYFSWFLQFFNSTKVAENAIKAEKISLRLFPGRNAYFVFKLNFFFYLGNSMHWAFNFIKKAALGSLKK